MFLLFVCVALIALTCAKQSKPNSNESGKITHAYDVCNLKDAKACSSHGTCTSFLRADKKPATRCQCNYPYVGETCGKKRFEAVKKKLKEESSSSSSSSSESSESSDESSDSEVSSESSESESSDRSSDSEEGSWGGNEDHHDRRHRETHEWTGWFMGIAFLVLICCCIGGIAWVMWRPMRVVKISGRA